MGKSFGLSLFVSVATLTSASALVRADDAPIEQSSVMVRAWGTTGSIEQVTPERSVLGADVNAGTISRAALRAELERGIGRFLQQVKTQAVVSHGHFVGWRLLSLFAKRPDVNVQVLRPGDTLVRVNGESIERPEAFKAVWDGLVDAKEIVLEIERDGAASKLHFAIKG